MKILKKGSRGNEVATLQKALGIIADGIFGPITEQAVRTLQKKNNLDVDGIVGPLTWAALRTEVDRLTSDMSGKTSTVDAVELKLKKSKRKITEIILHCTASKEGAPTTVEAIRNYHVNNRGWKDIGYHYVVYLDGSIHEGRDIDLTGAHCTGHNANSVGVVYVGGIDADGKPKDTRTVAQKKALVKLVKRLLTIYNLPSSKVYGHYQFANKACPSFKIEPFRFMLDS